MNARPGIGRTFAAATGALGAATAWMVSGGAAAVIAVVLAWREGARRAGECLKAGAHRLHRAKVLTAALCLIAAAAIPDAGLQHAVTTDAGAALPLAQSTRAPQTTVRETSLSIGTVAAPQLHPQSIDSRPENIRSAESGLLEGSQNTGSGAREARVTFRSNPTEASSEGDEIEIWMAAGVAIRGHIASERRSDGHTGGAQSSPDLAAPAPASDTGASTAAAATAEGQRLSEAQVINVLVVARWPQAELRNALCITWAESSWVPNARNMHNANGTIDYGLFQVNSIHSPPFDLLRWSDPYYNAAFALAVFRARELASGEGWDAWVTAQDCGVREARMIPAHRGAAYVMWIRLPAARSARTIARCQRRGSKRPGCAPRHDHPRTLLRQPRSTRARRANQGRQRGRTVRLSHLDATGARSSTVSNVPQRRPQSAGGMVRDATSGDHERLRVPVPTAASARPTTCAQCASASASSVTERCIDLRRLMGVETCSLSGATAGASRCIGPQVPVGD